MAVLGRIAAVGVLVCCVMSCSSDPSSTTTSRASNSTTNLTTIPDTTIAAISDIVPDENLSEFSVLVFHRTAGFRHDSIPAGIAALTEMGVDGGFTVTATEDRAIFADDALAAFQVIVFLSTTGDILVPEQQQAMERFIRAGGGFVGMHAAADTEYEWAWYGELVGAYFQSHPAPQPGRVEVRTGDHPITAGVPDEFVVDEEWYDFQSLPTPSVTVLATVDEGSYTGGTMGDIHPVVWAHEFDGGRSAYLAFGHDAATFNEPNVRLMLTQTVAWTAQLNRAGRLPLRHERVARTS